MGVAAIAEGPWSRGGSMGQVDPFQMVNQAMSLRNNMQQWNANQEAGNIMATSKNMEDAINQMRASPNAPWMLQTMNSIRTQQQTEADIARLQAETGKIGLDTSHDRMDWATKTANYDPFTFMKTMQAAINGASPLEKKMNGGAMEDYLHSMTDGLPWDDPQAAREQFMQRVIAKKIGAGLNMDEAYGGAGLIKPTMQSVTGPGGTQQIIQMGGVPGMFGGGGQAQPAAGGDASGGAIVGPGGNLLGGGGGQTGGGFGQSSGGGRVLYQGPGAAELAMWNPEETAKQASRFADDIAQAPSAVYAMDNIYKAMQGFTPGAGKTERGLWAERMQAFRDGGAPIPQSLINEIRGGSKSDADLFKAEIKTFVTQQLREAVKGTGAGRIRDEVQAFLDSMGQETDPKAIINLLNQHMNAIRVDADQAMHYTPFIHKVQANARNPGQFPEVQDQAPLSYMQWWMDNRSKDMDKNIGQYKLTPYDIKGVRGQGEQGEPTTSSRAWPAQKDRVLQNDDGSTTRAHYKGTGDPGNLNNWTVTTSGGRSQ